MTQTAHTTFPGNVSLPEGLRIIESPLQDPFMWEAAKHAVANAFPGMTVTASVIVKDGEIVSKGINGEQEDGKGYHQKTGKCEREGKPAGEGYEECPGCEEANHSEKVAIRKALAEGINLTEAMLYMFGHWWSCQSCLNAAHEAGITAVVILENARPFFDRSMPGAAQARKQLEEHIRNTATPQPFSL